MAAWYKDEKIDVVLAPALGGIVLGYEVAKQLGVSRMLFAERVQGRMQLRGLSRGFELRPRERVLIIEDVVCFGDTSCELISLVENSECQVVGIGCIADLRHATKLPCPLRSLTQIQFPVYSADTCPLCDAGVPLTEPDA